MVIELKSNRYEIIEEIGKGGMATVFRGWDKELEREVAIKLLHPYLSDQKESRARFNREARAVAKLKHINVIEIYDYSGKDSPQCYIVTEFIHGPTLRQFRENHPDMPPEIGLCIMIEVCAGLAHAHEQGIVHRDIKPENILIREDGVIKLSDFGIAQLVGTTHMTATGQILGSPAYMSPEHIECKRIDRRADIFSLGIVMYWLFTKRLPFEGENPHAVIKKIMDCRYIDPLVVAPEIGEPIAKIIKNCLKLSPEERYQRVEEIISEMKTVLTEMDIYNPKDEWLSYFKDPLLYEEEYKKDIVNRLIEKGKKYQKEKEIRKALDFFNRAIAYRPSDEELIAYVKGIEWKKRFKKILLTFFTITSALVFIGILIKGGFGISNLEKITTKDKLKKEKITKKLNEKTDNTNRAKVQTKTEMNTGTMLDSKGDTPILLTKPKNHSSELYRSIKHKNLSTSIEERFRYVRIIPYPPRAKVYIDGEYSFEFGGINEKDITFTTTGTKLRVGKHIIRLEPIPLANGELLNDPLDFEIIVPEGEDTLQIRRQLPWKPATVLILTQNLEPPPEVIIEGRERGYANRPFKVNMYENKENFNISIFAPGYKPLILKEVTLKAGEEFIKRVTLLPEK